VPVCVKVQTGSAISAALLVLLLLLLLLLVRTCDSSYMSATGHVGT
jgi:hypothetical protein